MIHPRKLALLSSLLPCFSALSAHASSFEALKAGTLTGMWESALKNPLPAPAAPAPKAVGPLQVFPAAVQTYERGGYTWESDAENAANAAASNLRSAGIAVMSTQIIRESESPWRYGFRMDYIDDSDPGLPPRALETYTSQVYSWSSDAENELRRTESNLRATGYVVVLGEVWRQTEAPWNYYYRVDYVRGRHNPGDGQAYLYTSGLYPTLATAQREMYVAQWRLQQQGYQIYGSVIYQEARTRHYFFQIRYGTR